MALFDFMRRGKAPKVGGQMPGVPFVASGSAWTNLWKKRSRTQYLEEYRNWTYVATTAIAKELAVTRFRLNKGRGRDAQPVDDHPILTLLERVNPFWGSYTTLFSWAANMELDGNAFWLLTKDARGVPDGIWPLRPDLVTVLPDSEQYIKGYRYKLGSKTFDLGREDVVHFKTFNPLDPYRGQSTLSAAISSVDTDNSARDWNQAFFDNGARPDVVLEYEGKLNDADKKRLMNDWNDRHKGAEKSQGATILGNGLKIHLLDVSQKDMDFAEMRRMNRDEVLAVFGVPASVVGITENMTFANAETTDYIFEKRTIRPKRQLLVDTLNEQLVPLFKSPDLFITFEDTVPRNREQDLATYQNGLANGWLSPNEVRAMEGRQPLKGGDQVFMPFGSEAYAEVVMPKEAKPKQIEKPSDGSLKDIASGIAKGLGSILKDVAENSEFESKGAKWNDAQKARGDKDIDKWTEELGSYFENQKNAVLAALEEKYKKGIKAADDDLVDAEASIDDLKEIVAKLMKVTIQREGEAAAEIIDFDDFDPSSEEFKKIIARNSKKLAGKVTKETTKKVREAIADGIANGEGLKELQDRIEDLDSFGKYRAELIARTEVTRTQGLTDIETWKQSGIVTKKVWYTAKDERVCVQCEDLHGKTISLEVSFYSKGDVVEDSDGNEEMIDYADVDGPPRHPQCRCSILPVIEQKSSRSMGRKQNPVQ